MMAAYDPRRARALYRLLIAIFIGAGILLPLQLWGTLRLSSMPTPFKTLAFSTRTEITMAAVLAAVAFLSAFTLIKKHRLAPYVCFSYVCLQMVHTILEAVLTYGTKKYFWGPKWAAIGSAALAVISLVVLSWACLTLIPRIMRDA